MARGSEKQVVTDLHYIFDYLRDPNNASGILADMVERSGLSKRSIAARCGVSPSAVSKMTREGDGSPRLDTYAAVMFAATDQIIDNEKGF